MNPEIFKAYDIRGRVGTELTKEVTTKVGRAFANWLPTEGPVAVGRDMRPDSADLAQGVIDGLRQQGRDVWDIGEVTSDMIYFAVGKNGLAGGVMITASHNPGDYNGVKFCREKAMGISIDSGLAQIRDAALKDDAQPADKQGSIVEKDLRKDWAAFVTTFVDVKSWPEYRVAVDAGNGMAGAIIPELQPLVPLQVTPMYFELDGTFPNHIANPMIPENLVDLQQKIRDQKLDFGMAFDGDGDRMVLVDETGEPLSGGVLSTILSEYFLRKNPGAKIVYDVRNSKSVPDIVKENGGQPVRVRVGHSFIKVAMREADAPFGSESSGHFYFRDNWYADSGLIAGMVAIQVLSESGKKLSELAADYIKYAAIPETNFEVEDKAGIIERIKQEFTDGEQDTLDGISVDFADGSWFNVRPSNTEPLLRLNVEAKTQEELDALVARVKKVMGVE